MKITGVLTPHIVPLIGGVQFSEGARCGVRLRGFQASAGRQPLSERLRAGLHNRERQLSELIKKEIHE